MVVAATGVSKSLAVGHRHEPPRLFDRFGDTDSRRSEDGERLPRRQKPDGIVVSQVQPVVVAGYSERLGELAGPVTQVGCPAPAPHHLLVALPWDAGAPPPRGAGAHRAGAPVRDARN